MSDEPKEWSRTAGGHHLNLGVMRLDVFVCDGEWRWYVSSGNDAEEAQGAAADEDDAKAKAVAWVRESLETALRRLPGPSSRLEASDPKR